MSVEVLQSQQGTYNSGSNNATAALAAPVTPTNALIAAAGWTSANASPTVTDNQGDSFFLTAETDFEATLAYSYDVTGGGTTVTLNNLDYICCCVTHQIPGALIVLEASGLLLTNPLDRVASNSTTTSSATVATGTTALTRQANELLVAYACNNQNITWNSVSAGWTMSTYSASATVSLALAWQIVSSPGAYSATFTGASSMAAPLAGIATFRAAVGPPPLWVGTYVTRGR